VDAEDGSAGELAGLPGGLQRSPSHAVRMRNVGHLRELLRAGIDPDEPGARVPPIRIAAERGELGVVRLLLQHGAFVDPVSGDGWTPLTAADAVGNEKMADLLLVNGADPAMREAHGYTPLHRAVLARDLDAVHSVIESREVGVDAPDAAGHVAVEAAIGMGQVEIARALLDAGASVDTLSDGFSLVALAAYRASVSGPMELLDLLIERGAAVNGGEYPAVLMAVNQEGSSVAVLRRLVESGASINATAEDGETVLHRIAEIATPELAAVALELGADLEARDGQGRTPYLAAALNDDVAEFLLAHGADPDAIDAHGDGIEAIRAQGVAPVLPAFDVPEGLVVEPSPGDALRFRGTAEAIARLVEPVRALSWLEDGAEVTVGDWRLRVSENIFVGSPTTVSLPSAAWNIAASMINDVVWAYMASPFDFKDCHYLSPPPAVDIGVILEGPPLS
jgi:ankyrin repeat protein